MKAVRLLAAALALSALLAGCGAQDGLPAQSAPAGEQESTGQNVPAGQQEPSGQPAQAAQTAAQKEESGLYTTQTPISQVIEDPVFGDYGRLIFPVDSGYYSGSTLGDLRLTWYSNIDPNKTVEIVNYLKQSVQSGRTVFYDIYTDEEKAQDPDKEDTGLFFFKGEPGERFAVCNAGGGFAYVGAMQDSFPHALELSKMGYNAFALIYRPGAQIACEDLARAISFIFSHAQELEVNTDGYSLWGGSAGGNSNLTRNDPPTFACVGENDGIANWRTMQRRIQALDEMGIPTEFHHYPGLRHGFGLGTGTVAEGWIDEAAAFWQRQVED